VHEDGATVLRFHFARARPPRELRLELRHQSADVDVHLRDGQRPDLAVRKTAIGGRDVVRVHDRTRLAALRELNCRDQIEPQAHEVHQIVAGQRLAAQVRVHEAQSTEAPLGRAQASDVGEHQLRGVADDDAVDLAGAVHEHAHLAPDFERNGGERAGKLGVRDVVGGHATPREAFQRAQGRWRQTGLVAEDVDGCLLSTVGQGAGVE
jgi:hypothetical protein